MRFAAPTPKMAEAAQANRGGLECSSYTWQVRQGSTNTYFFQLQYVAPPRV